MTEVADHYRTARLRITELVLSLDDDELARAVPACPGEFFYVPGGSTVGNRVLSFFPAGRWP